MARGLARAPVAAIQDCMKTLVWILTFAALTTVEAATNTPATQRTTLAWGHGQGTNTEWTVIGYDVGFTTTNLVANDLYENTNTTPAGFTRLLGVSNSNMPFSVLMPKIIASGFYKYWVRPVGSNEWTGTNFVVAIWTNISAYYMRSLNPVEAPRLIRSNDEPY